MELPGKLTILSHVDPRKRTPDETGSFDPLRLPHSPLKMNQVPFGGCTAVASRLCIAAFLLCSAAIGGAASVERPVTVPPRIQSMDSDDFKPLHGMALNRVRFLTDGVRTVEIPAGSLLNLPENGRIRIAKELVGDLVDWVDFFNANLDMIRQVGVTRKQLRGEREIHPAVSDHLRRSRKTGIAIAAGRPVALPQPS